MRHTVLFLFLLIACKGEAELDVSCGAEGCLTCEVDADCIVAHNPCHELAWCIHADDETFALASDGCSPQLEYGTPPDSECVCSTQALCAVSSSASTK